MARTKGAKNITIEEKISALENEILSIQDELKEKKEKLRTLNSEKKEAENARLLAAIESSGKSVDDILKILGEEE